MNQFIEARLFLLIRETAEVTLPVSEWEKAYESFAGTVFAAGTALDPPAFHNVLCFTKSELAFLQSQDRLKKKSNEVCLYRENNLSD